MFASGDVQIGLMDKKGQLEVEVIRARGLTPKPGSKSLPGKRVLICFLFSECVSERPSWNLLQHHTECCFMLFYGLIDLMMVFAVHSSICQGLLAGQWSMQSQKENQDCTKNTRPIVSAVTAV